MAFNIGNLKVESELEVKEFLKAVQKRDDFDPTVYLIPDFPERRLGVFYHVGDEAGDGKVIKTVLEGVNFQLRYTERSYQNPEVRSWILHYDDAENFLTFLNSYKWERTPAQIRFEWEEETGMPMMQDSRFGEERLLFQYKTESGNQQKVSINNIYRSDVHRIVNFK